MGGLSVFRRMSNILARLRVRPGRGGQPTNGRQDKSAAFGRAHVVGWTIVSSLSPSRPTGAKRQFRVAWVERRYENASLAATERWTAILTIVLDTPHDAERLRRNPLGVFVHAINWSKELG
jgi:type IV secretory pathway TrbF-like protein